MLYTRDNENIFFVHIPRTGGRFFNELLLFNGFKKRGKSEKEDVVDGIPIMHLHLDYLKKNKDYVENKKFCIIRNPYERLRSVLRYNRDNLKVTKDSIIVKNETNFNKGVFLSWVRPQVEFVSEDTLIWRYEKGLENNLCKFIKDEFNIDINYSKVTYDQSPEDFIDKIALTKDQIEFVNKYYKKDFIRFNYETI
tara:strand:+ start:814 stop:1398 length:585 start_codon:yes stop_codon:yes gene_type:complete